MGRTCDISPQPGDNPFAVNKYYYYYYIWETGEVHTGILWRDLRESDHLEDPDVDERIILR
jgi:hypothetical protein